MSSNELMMTKIDTIDGYSGVKMQTLNGSGVNYYGYFKPENRSDKYLLLVKNTSADKKHLALVAGDTVLGGGNNKIIVLEPNSEYALRPNLGKYLLKGEGNDELRGSVMIEADTALQVAVVQMEY